MWGARARAPGLGAKILEPQQPSVALASLFNAMRGRGVGELLPCLGTSQYNFPQLQLCSLTESPLTSFCPRTKT